MSTYAIGDLQGCYQQLQQLLHKVNYSSEKDFLWFCGDLINRGPDSLKCLKFVKERVEAAEAVTVLGNHDLHFLAVAAGLKPSFATDTLDELLLDNHKYQFIDFLRQQPLCFYDTKLDFFLVHAGLIPQWDQQSALQEAGFVEKILLQDDNYETFLKHMYGDEPNGWRDNLPDIDRARFITNVLTRIRFCTPSGQLDLKHKGSLNSQPDHLLPWFQLPNRKSEKNRIIFGHWAQLYCDWEAIKTPKIFPIDSGCVWGNTLTALELETQTYYSYP